MKKLLLLCLAAFALTGCEDKPKTWYVTTDYTIVNQIESDIVVELKFGDREVITIEPGDTRVVYNNVRRYVIGERDALPTIMSIVEERGILDAEMKIDGEVVPEDIWYSGHWKHYSEDSYYTRTLTVNDKLIRRIKEQGQLPFTEYILPAPAHWGNLDYPNDRHVKLMTFNSEQWLNDYVIGGEAPAVDFSEKTLLVAWGYTPREVSEANVVDFRERYEGIFELYIDVVMTSSTGADRWVVAALVDKLDAQSHISLRVNEG